jgi:poly-gamma-glutamate synthase PgsB/CapB
MHDVALSLAGTVPRGTLLVTAEDDFAGLFAAKAKALGSRFVASDPAGVSEDELRGFQYVEFAENLALALAACEAAGVDRRRALAGMWTVKPDIGALVPYRWREGDKDIEFVNLFAANDPESTAFVWEHLGLPAHADEAIAMVNIRADRMRRSKDLAPLFGGRIQAAHYLIIGEQTDVFAEILRRQGLPAAQIVCVPGRDAAAVLAKVMAIGGPRVRLVGLGNIGGVGVDLLALVEGRCAAGREVSV